METRREQIARRGLVLARHIVRRLDRVGIHVRADVSLEHQHLAQTLRGSGRGIGRSDCRDGTVRNVRGRERTAVAVLAADRRSLRATDFTPSSSHPSLCASTCFAPDELASF